MNKPSRLLSICLALALLIGLMPLQSLAAAEETRQEITGITITAEPKVYDGRTDNPVLKVTFAGPAVQPAPEDEQVVS